MKTSTTKTLVMLALFGAAASIASATYVTYLPSSSIINNFSSDAQFTGNMLPIFDYAIGVGNQANHTVGGYTFLGDAVGFGLDTPSYLAVVPGYTVSNGKAYGINSPHSTINMTSADLNPLLSNIRYGANNQPITFTLPVTAGKTYNLQLMVWENYFATPDPNGRYPFNDGDGSYMSIDTTGNLNGQGQATTPAFNISDTITDLAGPSQNNAFLWSYTFKPTVNTVTLTTEWGALILNGIVLTEAVPEPSTVWLFLLGGVVIWFGWKRRHHRLASLPSLG